MRKILKSGLTSVFSTNPKKSPIRKHPIKFTARVPYGNADRKRVKIWLDKRYRRIPPIKLPKPINKSVFILNNFIPDTVFLLYIKLPLGGGCEKEIVRDTAKLRIIPKVPIPSEKIPNHQIFSKQNNLVRREIISGIRILLVKTDIFLKFMVAKP
jgi:hypothetical protein